MAFESFVLVLVVVLVLDSLRAECWSTGVSEYCAFSELRLRSGAFRAVPGSDLFPGVETQAQSFNPFGIVRERFPNPRLQRRPGDLRFETNPQAV
jgi:hypothetical protein